MKLVEKFTSSCIEIVPSVDKHVIITEKSLNTVGREDFHDGFFLCDLGDILSKYQRWVKAFPRITPHYAVKCNPDPVMLKMLLALGTGFDCASKGEIRQLLGLGAQSDQIIFANPCKQASHVRYSRDNGVKLVVIDSDEELVKMKKNFPDAELVLRIQTDDSKALIPFSMKFGATMKLSYHLIDSAYKMGLKMTGISFHVGSRCQEVDGFVEALQNARALFDYAKSVGYNFNLLDIGGGFPGSDNAKVKFEQIASIVNQHLDKLFPANQFEHVRIIAEPGRYFAESAFTLATNVIAKKKVPRTIHENGTGDSGAVNEEDHTSSEEPAFMYYINDGVYGAFNCMFYDCAAPLPNSLKPAPEKAHKFSSSIWGPTCDGLDRIVEHLTLPELDTSDWLIWQNMGAYTVAASSSFNGFLTTKVYYVISQDDLSLFRKVTGGKELPELELKWKGQSLKLKGQNNQQSDLCEKTVAKKLAYLQNGSYTVPDVEPNVLPALM